jgi:hypothetical protein
MSDYIARQPINAPNSYARAYNPGDPVTAQVVAEWGLAVGTQVEPDGDYTAPRPAEDSDDRAAWETYVVGKGTSLADARAASLDDLRGLYEPDPQPEPPAHDLPANAAAEGVDGTGWQNATPVGPDNIPGPDNTTARPAESAKKDVWVTWVVEQGADRGWAHDPETTKADLIAWAPAN